MASDDEDRLRVDTAPDTAEFARLLEESRSRAASATRNLPAEIQPVITRQAADDAGQVRAALEQWLREGGVASAQDIAAVNGAVDAVDRLRVQQQIGVYRTPEQQREQEEARKRDAEAFGEALQLAVAERDTWREGFERDFATRGERALRREAREQFDRVFSGTDQQIAAQVAVWDRRFGAHATEERVTAADQFLAEQWERYGADLREMAAARDFQGDRVRTQDQVRTQDVGMVNGSRVDPSLYPLMAERLEEVARADRIPQPDSAGRGLGPSDDRATDRDFATIGAPQAEPQTGPAGLSTDAVRAANRGLDPQQFERSEELHEQQVEEMHGEAARTAMVVGGSPLENRRVAEGATIGNDRRFSGPDADVQRDEFDADPSWKRAHLPVSEREAARRGVSRDDMYSRGLERTLGPDHTPPPVVGGGS